MIKKEITIRYTVFSNIDELLPDDRQLLFIARKATDNAYAPYSNFHVAASALLDDGSIVSATNQENASSPIGICAERTLLAALSAVYPQQKIITLAISYHNLKKDINDTPATPCGMCRQALAEWQQRQITPFKLILSGQIGDIWIIENANDLLPLSFVSDFIK
jgi:cytidine deaminase